MRLLPAVWAGEVAVGVAILLVVAFGASAGRTVP
jgi:hypothetical protein